MYKYANESFFMNKNTIIPYHKNGILILALVLLSISFGCSQSQIPVLCYHNIYKISGTPGPLYINEKTLEKHIQFMSEKGYKSVMPEDILNHTLRIKLLEGKNVMFSFDDTRLMHYTVAAPLLEKYGYRGTFFIMTVAIGKKNYMTKKMIRDLADRGHSIGLHTYDHQDLRKISAGEWKNQIDRPRQMLEDITGYNICYLAYPYGACNKKTAGEVRKRGISASFQLASPMQQTWSEHFIRRLMVSGTWSPQRLENEMMAMFGKK